MFALCVQVSRYHFCVPSLFVAVPYFVHNTSSEDHNNLAHYMFFPLELTFKLCSIQAQHEQNNTSTENHFFASCHSLAMLLYLMTNCSFNWKANITDIPLNDVSHSIFECGRMKCYDHLTRTSGIIHTCIILVHL